MRHVVHVCTDPGVPVFGTKGASVHVQSVLRVLLRRGVRVSVLCARPGGAPPKDLEAVRVLPLPPVAGHDPASRERSAMASDAAVTTTLEQLHRRDEVDLVYERYALWGRSATAWAARRQVPSVLEVNAPLVEEQRRHRVLVDEREAEDVARAALGAAGAVVCVSEAVAAWSRARTRGTVPVTVVPNGVDTRRFGPPEDPVRPPPFTIGFVGTLKPWHGVASLVDALAVLADRSYRLLVVGDGPEAASLATRAARLGVADGLELVGAVHPDEVPALLRQMDVAAAPYPALADFYFSPLKLYEYLAAGLPVVASDVGPLPGLLEHGRWGELVPPDDAEALAGAVATLRRDPVRRQAIRDGAPLAAAAHDWDHVVERSLALVGASWEGRDRGIG